MTVAAVVSDAIHGRDAAVLLPASLFQDVVLSVGIDPEALIAEVEDALRFEWDAPPPVHDITATTWTTHDVHELLRLLGENAAADLAREADEPPVTVAAAEFDRRSCAVCTRVRVIPAGEDTCNDCWRQGPSPDAAVELAPTNLIIDAHIPTDGLAELIILYPAMDVWNALTNATGSPARTALMWDKAMNVADEMTRPDGSEVTA